MPWNVVEVSPGKFVWDDYATMLDLAARHGIRVVLAEMLVDFPEWLIAAHPEARIEMASGQKRQSEMHISSVNGGHHALCLNHPAVSETAERFLTAMANRFRGHPALLGYDIWNECTQYVAERLCFCSACQQAFRDGLKATHGDIATLAKRWHRPSLTAFHQIELPRTPVLFPDFLDSIRWRNDDGQHWMRWRRDVLRKADPKDMIIAHGNAKTHTVENAVLLTLRRRGTEPTFAAALHEWACDFVMARQTIQCCARLTPENRQRELRGLIEAAKLPGGQRGKGCELLVITLDQEDARTEQGLKIRLIPAWKWLD